MVTLTLKMPWSSSGKNEVGNKANKPPHTTKMPTNAASISLEWRKSFNTVRWYACDKRSKPRLKPANKRPNKPLLLPVCGCALSICAHMAGVKVSATNTEKPMAAMMVMANWRYITPVEPGKNAMGTNTADKVMPTPIKADEISFIDTSVAVLASSCCSCITRSTFSTTTMASSTNKPMANTKANMVKVLME